MKKKKKHTLKQLKRKADEVFSRYIRQRDANLDGYAACVTCGQFRHWKEGDCGHYWSRTKLPTRFHEKNAHFQCKRCNGPLRGNMPAYSSFMYRTYGELFMDQLEALARTENFKYYPSDYEEIIQEFERKTEELKK